MDSLTQAVLGAGIGEAVLGKQVGNKAPLWGAFAGTLPDLDVMVYPLYDAVDRLGVHRGFSHSIVFAVLAASLLGWMVSRLHGQPAKKWCALFFLSIVTHPLLDCFTVYGTGLLEPFTDRRIAWSTIFIIDPLYTLPFLACMVTVLLLRDPRRRTLVNRWGVGISCGYLLITMANKVYMDSVFERALNEKNITYARLLTTPTPANTVLWRAIVEREKEFLVGYHSWFDSQPVEFAVIPKRHDLVDSTRSSRAVAKLIWFSQNWFVCEHVDGIVRFHDLRFGQTGLHDGSWIFSWTIAEENGVTHFKQSDRLERISGGHIAELFTRATGN